MEVRTEGSSLLSRVKDMPRPLQQSLVDGDVTLRLPVLGDRHKLAQYASDAASLEGVWLPLGQPDPEPDVWAAWFARELVLGWSPMGGRYGGVLVIDHAESPFVGIIGLLRLEPTVAEITYGVAPVWRGRGMALRATRMAMEWALSDGGFDRVEAKIGQNHAESLRVIEKAGFRLEETFKTYVEGTGETCDDVLYASP